MKVKKKWLKEQEESFRESEEGKEWEVHLDDVESVLEVVDDLQTIDE
jgi:hypothetical protein